MPKKLQYFDFNGLAEPIRYILHFTKQDFEDYRHDIATWPDQKIKASVPAEVKSKQQDVVDYGPLPLTVRRPVLQQWEHYKGLPYGQFPLYEEDGKVLTQTLAIAKYVARGTELIPADPWQHAIVESAVYTVFDYWKNVTPVFLESDPVKKEELKKKLFDETIDFYFSRFSKQLSENGGYFNGKLSWGEFILTGIVEASNLFLKIELEKMYPVVGATVDKIRSLPGVKEYIKTRGVYKLPAKFDDKK